MEKNLVNCGTISNSKEDKTKNINDFYDYNNINEDSDPKKQLYKKIGSNDKKACGFNLTPSKTENSNEIRSQYKTFSDYSTISAINEFGFIVGSIDILKSNHISNKYDWYEVLETYSENIIKFKEKVKKRRLLQNGLPVFLRKKVWYILLMKKPNIFNFNNINSICKNIIKSKVENDNFKTFNILQKPARYEILKRKRSEYDYQIHVDIQRTFRCHYLFNNKFGKGQTELFNILVAFANSFKDVGYCQGMSDVAAIFLMYFAEDEAFDMMSSFFRSNGLNRIFDKKFTKLPQILKMQNEILYQLLPDIFWHLKEDKENAEICLISWYFTLFTRFPINFALRIWDFMIFYGFNVVFYFVCSIFFVFKADLLKLTGENLLVFLNRLHEAEIDEKLENEIVDRTVKFMEELNFNEII